MSVRFGGEFSETYHSNMERRRELSQCTIVKEGEYAENRFYIRYFQPDGKGELRLDDERILSPNDLYPLKNEVFRLYYTSACSDQQTIDIYIVDSFGQTVQKTFSFQNERTDDEEETDNE